MRRVCTSCDTRLVEDAIRCGSCGDGGVIAQECHACGEVIRLSASMCRYCNAVVPGRAGEASAHMQALGEELMVDGRPVAALSRFDQACAADPGSAAPRFGRAAALRDQGRFEEAVAALRDALVRSHSEREWKMRLPELAVLRTRAALARPASTQRDPFDPRGSFPTPSAPSDLDAANARTFVCIVCWGTLAASDGVCGRCGRTAGVAKACGRCGVAIAVSASTCPFCHGSQTDFPDVRAQAAVTEAERLVLAGRPADAEQWFDAALEIRPGAPSVWVAKAAAQRAAGREEAAWMTLRLTFDVFPLSDVVARTLSEWTRSGEIRPPSAFLADRDDFAAALASRARGAGGPARWPPNPSTSADPTDRLVQEARWRQKIGPRWRAIEEAILKPPTASDAAESARLAELDAAPDAEAPAASSVVGGLLASADILAEAGRLAPALAQVERALAIDIATPGGAERWRRWGALARESALTREALVASAPAERDRVRRELCGVARDLEASAADAAAAVAWSLAGEERARLRLLAQPHVCEALSESLVQSCEAAGAPGTVASLVREGGRRAALVEAVAALARDEHPEVATIAALVMALVVRGPRVDLWRAAPDTAALAALGPSAVRLLSAARVRVALGERVTVGRLGAAVCVSGPGVAPEHIALWRDASGAALLADAGTAVGTTLAGARLAAPLPVGDGLRVELAGRVPLHAAPLDPARAGSPLVLDAAGELWLVPLGPLAIGPAGELHGVEAEDGWLSIQSLATPGDTSRWVVLRTTGGDGVFVHGVAAAADVELCFGDVLRSAPEAPPVLVVRPPADERG